MILSGLTVVDDNQDTVLMEQFICCLGQGVWQHVLMIQAGTAMAIAECAVKVRVLLPCSCLQENGSLALGTATAVVSPHSLQPWS